MNGDKETYLAVISKHLFNLDNAYEFMLSGVDTSLSNWPMLKVFNENKDTLFICDSCTLNSNYNQGSLYPSPIKYTPIGSKLIVFRGFQDQYDIYSLPGKLPGCTQALGVNDPSIALSQSQIPTSAYPNPATGRVRIAYELPAGVSSGELVLMNVEAKELKRYHITNAFNNLLIEAGDLPSGSYFYKVVTEKGESATQRVVLVK